LDDRDRPARRHRADLQGLRAVAVLLVVFDHARIGPLRGGFVGIDVFFVLSGFLITGLLLSQVEARGKVPFLDFYLRRARRILPAAALTLVAVNVAVLQIVDFVRAKPMVWDSIWASLFAANIRFGGAHVDYFTQQQGQPTSPVLHFWTLAVEEQFYVVWPTIIFLVVFGPSLVRRALRRPRRRTGENDLRRLLVTVTVAVGASLAWSIYDTQAHPRSAYFSTFTRAWELGLGAGLAIGAAWLARHSLSTARAVLGWGGACAILVAGLVYSSSTHFPGYAALLPTLGAVLVICAGLGHAPARLGVGRVLALRPFQYVGDRSYAFYLWHWPVLILGALYVGHEPGLFARVLLVLGAFLLSVLSYRFFENPIRHMRSRPLSALLWPASIGAVAVAAVLALASISAAADRFQANGTPGEHVQTTTIKTAYRRTTAVTAASGSVLPSVIATVEAAKQGAGIPGGLVPRIDKLGSSHYSYPPGCEPGDGQTSSRVCRLGKTTSKRSIAVIGDSHLRVWMPTILQVAERDGWVVRPFTKPGCLPFRWTRRDSKRPECQAWFNWVVRRTRALRPTVALIGGAFAPLPGSPLDGGQTSAGAFKSLTAALKPFTKHVVVLGDVPYQSQGIVDCLLSSGATLLKCSTTPTRPQLYEYIAAQTRFTGASFLDVRGWFCYQDVCPMVIGHTIAYWNPTHISTAYALKLTGPFRAAFRAAIR
jgi:peptidoglycan/LPS O-acetylase OafA/YrhL